VTLDGKASRIQALLGAGGADWSASSPAERRTTTLPRESKVAGIADRAGERLLPIGTFRCERGGTAGVERRLPDSPKGLAAPPATAAFSRRSRTRLTE
jgi:hypothetical protein